MVLAEPPTERHREIAGVFADRVAVTRDWQAPAPVTGWTARDVVGHLVGWFPGFQASAVQELFETRGGESFTHPYAGTHRLADAVDRFYTADVFMHTWDLARATGQEPDLDDAYATTLLDGMQPIEEMLRSSGQYGAPVTVAADAPVTELSRARPAAVGQHQGDSP